MKIFNILMNRQLGGAEQSFLDYNNALTSKGYKVINISSSFAKVNDKITNTKKLPNLVPWCILSKIYLKVLAILYKPNLIIVHGGRAVNFACGANIKNVPIIGVTHSYSIRHILKCNYIIALDCLLKKHLVDNGYSDSQIAIIPNMVNAPLKKTNKDGLKTIIPTDHCYVIGALGRFVPEKGFNYLIEAISILKDRKYNVKLMLAGSGALEDRLKKLAQSLNIGKNVEFIGWIEDKKSFFDELDIFCIPSVFETFGIVALEAMSQQVAIVSTKTLGASEIFEAGIDALLAKTASSQDLADKIADLIDNPIKRMKLTDNAYGKIINKYNMPVVADELSKTLENVLLRSP